VSDVWYGLMEKEKRINILAVIDHGGYNGNMAGVGRNVSYILPHIDQKRFKVFLAILRDDGSLKTRLKGTGIKIYHLKRKKFDPLTLYDLIKIIRTEKIDLLHLYQYASSNFGRIAGRLTGIPTILHAGDLNYDYPWYQRIADRVLKHATDHVIAVSESAKDSYSSVRKIDPSKIKVIPNAIAKDGLKMLHPEACRDLKKKLNLKVGFSIVGTVTRLHDVKGNEVLLQAARIVLQRLPETYFIIVGDGPLKNKLMQCAQDLGIQNNVIFTGYQNNVSEFLSIFDVKVIASNTEGFSLALLEAMAMGKAIVATEVGGIREILKNGATGMLVPPQNPSAMAEKIVCLIQHPEERKRFGAAAREESRKYSVDRHVGMREKVYEQAVSKHKFRSEKTKS
jgi:glycosyltransferase involved in cell wall biosynthesis